MRPAKRPPEPVIETARLRLRPLRREDAGPSFALFADWRVVRSLSAPPWPYRREDARDFVAHVLDAPKGQAERVFVIERDGALIGTIGVRMRPASHLQRGAGPNIGYWIGHDHWGHGYMTEALNGLVRSLFASGREEAIYSGAFSDNHASLRVQEKVGFVRDGETLLRSRPRDGDFPHINTVLTRARFAALVAA